MDFMNWIGEIILICPWIIWGLIYIVLKKIKRWKMNAFQFASDITTFILLWSIHVIMNVLFDINIGVITFIIAIIIAMVYLIVEWKNQKEIDLKKIAKKIWRTLFVVLTISYLAIVVVFVLKNLIDFFY